MHAGFTSTLGAPSATSALGPPTPAGEAQVPVTAGEAVARPEPGLARGRWEAPQWVFVAVAFAALLGGLARLGSVLVPGARRRKPAR